MCMYVGGVVWGVVWGVGCACMWGVGCGVWGMGEGEGLACVSHFCRCEEGWKRVSYCATPLLPSQVVEQFSETAAAAMQAMPKSAVTPPSARAEQEDSYAFPTTPRHIAPSPSSSDEEGAGVQGGEEGGKRGGAGAGGRGRRHRRRLVPDDE